MHTVSVRIILVLDLVLVNKLTLPYSMYCDDLRVRTFVHYTTTRSLAVARMADRTAP